MSEKFKQVLKQVVLACEYRAGDVSTEDGDFATTDIDLIKRLQEALYDDLDERASISILKDLEVNEIFFARPVDSKTIAFYGYSGKEAGVELTNNQLLLLISELLDIHNKMNT